MPFSKEVQEKRRAAITATDAAPIARLSPWRTPADVWVEKKHPELTVEFEEGPELYWGNKKEAIIREEYAKVTGQIVEKHAPAVSAQHAWLMCSPDGMVAGKNKGMEVKTVASANRREWGPDGTDLIPMHYLIQVLFSMLVTGYKEWDVAVLIDASDFRIYHIFEDAESSRYLFEIVEEFYKRFVLGDERPEFDWGKGTEALILNRWPKHVKGKELNVDTSGDEKLRRAITALRNIKRMMKDCEAEEPGYRATIQSYMGDSERLIWAAEDVNVLWRASPGKPKVDWHALGEEMLPLLTAEIRAATLKKHTAEAKGMRKFLFRHKAGGDEDDE